MSLVDQITSPLVEIFDFVRPYYKYVDDDTIRDVITKHWLYGTIDVIHKNDEIVAVVRWNVSPDRLTFDVLDIVIQRGECGFRVMKHLIARNWHRFPSVQFIRFSREHKYAGREPRVYSIKRLLKVRT